MSNLVRSDLQEVSNILGRSSNDINVFIKKYDLAADDLLDILQAGDTRRYALMILAAMRGNNKALRQLDNLLGFL
tara:strand:+ start:694 stop:918 length:225 start_codon:yes stop_codon:yes gene_type:complete